MLSIDMEGRLGEKRAKELVSSLEYMLNSVAQVLKERATQTNDVCSFKISFDNGKSLQMMAFSNKENTYLNMEFFDEYCIPREEISLQEALNLNKYALDIKTRLDSIARSENFTLSAYYTEQSIERKFPIYAEHNKEDRQSVNSTKSAHFRSRRVQKHDEIER